MMTLFNNHAAHKADRFLEEATNWVSSLPDAIGLALVGSYARNAARPDSDIDLVLIAENPQQYLSAQEWIERFGRIVKKQIEPYGLVTSIRVFYENGLEVEFGITDERWVALPLDAGTRQVMDDGMRVLFERGDMLSRHQRA